MVKEISAQELEEAYRKCIRAEVTDVNALSNVLNTMKVNYNIIADHKADIFEQVNISKLAAALAKENCDIISVYEKDESLESYFIGLVGGENNE